MSNSMPPILHAAEDSAGATRPAEFRRWFRVDERPFSGSIPYVHDPTGIVEAAKAYVGAWQVRDRSKSAEIGKSLEILIKAVEDAQ